MRVAAIIVGLAVASAPALAKDPAHARKPAERQSTAAPAAIPTGFSADAVGWRLIEDPATGARLGLPEKLVPRTDVSSRGGSRWTSAQGQIQIETFRLAEASLPALFDEEKKAAKRQIEGSDLKNDAFVIKGAQGLKNFVVRADARGGEVRGVTVLYDQATEGTMDSIAAAMAAAFSGFPDPKAEPPAGIRRAVEYATAIVVGSDGDLIAPAHVTDDCQSVTVPPLGHAERIAVDKTSDLALLRLYGARNLVAAPLADGATSVKAGELTLVGIADPLAQAGGSEVTRAKARLTAQGIEPTPVLGFAGAAAVAGGGAWAGMVDVKSPVVAAGGSSTAQAAMLVPVQTVRAFLQAHGIAPATGTPENRAIEQSVVRVVCVRK